MIYLKYSPCKSNNKETTFNIKDNNTLIIDGIIDFEFDSNSIEFPDIREQSKGLILEAYRDGKTKDLYITILRRYRDNCPWDDNNYHEVF